MPTKSQQAAMVAICMANVVIRFNSVFKEWPAEKYDLMMAALIMVSAFMISRPFNLPPGAANR